MTGKTSKNKEEDATEALQNAEEGSLEVVLPQPPDGGWGWVIVAASLLANVIVDGITYTFGLFLPKFQQAFQVPKRTIALAGSLQVGTYLCVGPIVSALTNRFGCKAVVMTGSLIAMAGFVISAYSPSVEVLIVTYGVIGGFGFGMMYLPAIVIVGYYFEKRRALATGIAVCGSGVGMFIMAPLSDKLLHEFGYRGALLILGGLVFNGAICGVLMRALPDPKMQNTVIDGCANGTPEEVKELLIEQIEKPRTSKQRSPIVILDGKGSSSGSSARRELAFSSVPNMVFSSAKDAKVQLTEFPPFRQRSNTLEHTDGIHLRHVEKAREAPKPSTAPIGLSYIGLSDASINRVRLSTQLNLSRREIFVSGSVLHIPDHNVQQSHLRSGLSVLSYRSTMSKPERVLCSCLPESARDTLMQMLDFSIMKNKAYVLILVGNVFAMLGFYVPFVFMPEKALGLGIPEAQAAFLLSIIGITNTVGRVLTGVLANLNKIDSLVINNIAMLICGLATFVTPFCDNYILLCIVAAVFGLCVAAYISLSSILLCDMLGVEQLTNAFGFLTLARGVSSCAGSPLAGAIIDATNDVNLAFYVGGALIVAGSLFHFMLHTPCIRRDKNSQKSYRNSRNAA